MSTKVGLQLLNEAGEVYFDLTKRPTIYLGEVDIIPTVSTGECSGEINMPFSKPSGWSYDFFYEIKKLYINSIDIDRKSYALPKISKEITYPDAIYKIKWAYTYSSGRINIGVRIAYGVY